ncbi:MAG: DUF1003 domain-containing protein [Chitinispirillaceae bacterium]|nr:DUF1003 domain-containing protein [Chitinispirillaceae bacterium]
MPYPGDVTPLLIIFALFLSFWVTINSLIMAWRPVDPYPFILLNLVLSCLAAIQAPVIMMSQKRQNAKGACIFVQGLEQSSG